MILVDPKLTLFNIYDTLFSLSNATCLYVHMYKVIE